MSRVPKVELPLSLPSQMVDEIIDWGARLDRSGSHLLGSAWRLSRDWLTRLDRPTADEEMGRYRGKATKRKWYLGADAMLEIACHAERLKVTPEQVVELAWSFSRPGT